MASGGDKRNHDGSPEHTFLLSSNLLLLLVSMSSLPPPPPPPPPPPLSPRSSLSPPDEFGSSSRIAGETREAQKLCGVGVDQTLHFVGRVTRVQVSDYMLHWFVISFSRLARVHVRN